MGLFSKLFGETSTPKTAQIAANVSGRRILIVDPRITIQKVIELTLPGATITAVKLSDRSGYDLCSTVKSSGTTPVILLTGTFEAFDDNRARQCGADSILTKPFESSA